MYHLTYSVFLIRQFWIVYLLPTRRERISERVEC